VATIVVGIDPGSRVTGYGILEVQGNRYRLLDSGIIKPPSDDIADRVTEIHARLGQLFELYQPAGVAIEDVFYEKNVQSTIKLAYARAAALIAARSRGIALYAYTPAQIKQTLVGNGRATKEQVAHMVGLLTGRREARPADESDAIAVAVCHAHHGALAR